MTRMRRISTALLVAVVYALLNYLLYRVLVVLSLPMIAVTFGLFLLIVNAFLLWLTDKLVPGFSIKGFPRTFLASFLISLLDSLFHWVLPWI